MKSQKRDDLDSPKGNTPIRVSKNILYDLDELITNDQNCIVVNFSQACLDDNSVSHKKAACSTVNSTLQVLDQIHADCFKDIVGDVEFFTNNSNTTFEYYIQERIYFLSVTVSNIPSKKDLQKIRSHVETFFD